MTISIRQIHPVFVGEVMGAGPDAADDGDRARRDRCRHGPLCVLVFRDQNSPTISRWVHAGIRRARSGARRRNITSRHELRLKQGMIDVVEPRQGRQAARALRPPPHFQISEPLWHSDSSFAPFRPSIRFSRRAASPAKAAIPSSPTWRAAL